MQLTEFSLDLGERAVDLETLQAISSHCRQLEVLRLYGVKDKGPYSLVNYFYGRHKITNMS